MNILAFWMPGGLELLIIVFLFPIVFIIPVIAFWKICSKAGFPAPLGLFMLVPVANRLLPLYLAFAHWPAPGTNAPSSSERM